uniref:Uncharacterized protein n=1 Tax=Candidatus Methanogaster sp. ANME-2c ERB4 TaxID=2759911 RepID=A0A7G9Y2X8_9EURY|nr:hypothetical protein LFOPHFOE_00002 [Methanosarcinales archaeon ANME-2c ERB4]
MEACSFDQAQHELGGSNQAKYICRYAKDINVNTVVIEDKYIDKETILTKPLPHFLWIIRTYYDRIPTMDAVYDETAVFPKKFRTIRFLH